MCDARMAVKAANPSSLYQIVRSGAALLANGKGGYRVMRSRNRVFLWSVLVLATGGCDTISGWTAHPDTYFTDNEQVTVDLYGPDNYKELLIGRILNDVSKTTKKDEDEIREACSRISLPTLPKKVTKPPETFAPVLIAAAATAAAGLAIDQSIKALQEERSRYTARFTGKFSGEFYSDGKAKYSCFAITRKSGAITMNLVGAFHMSPDGTAMQVKPVRIYYPKTKAKATWLDEAVAVAIVLNFTSVWKDINGVYHSEPSASTALYGKNIKLGDKTPKYLGDSDWSESDWLVPIIPSSNKTGATDTAKATDTGNFTMTATVIETTETGADIVGVVAETLRAKKPDIVNVIVNSTGVQPKTK
jgi:hypothetical protein